MSYNSFEDLEVWKRSCRLAVDLYELLEDCRDYGLKNQMTRAAVSVASNIAEGAERGSAAEYIRFLDISKGSTAELRTQLYISQRIKLMPAESCNELIKELKEISSMLHGLIRSKEE
ncbi:four helix bundle protein [Desulfobacterales bacterium HSG2]|nr:four helix bundle protein [Desulfobacterales bacterium HSG2]